MPDYVLMTSAYNEAGFLPDTIRSVTAQSHLPVAWIIVSDGSTDDTDRIAAEAAGTYGFIHFLRFDNPVPKTPHGKGQIAWRKVAALRAGLEAIADIPSTYLGNLDADITMGPDYLPGSWATWRRIPRSALAGGSSSTAAMAGSGRISSIPTGSAARSSFFRRAVFERIGGYVPWGHEDTIVQITLRMNGSKIRSFEDLRALHHKLPAAKQQPARGRVSRGQDGTGDALPSPACRGAMLATLARPPIIVGSMARFCGYFWATAKGVRTVLPDDVAAFNRHEQLANLRSRIFRSGRT